MAKLLGIAYRDEKRGPMHQLRQAEVTLEQGVHTDLRGRNRNHRQVTVLGKEGWQAACNQLNQQPNWTTRRANLFIEGIELMQTTGSKLSIGELQLEITGELDPCQRMDEQVSGLTDALTPDWRGGVTCRIISPGNIKVGDTVSLSS